MAKKHLGDNFRKRDDVIKWKHLPCYWPSVWGIHRAPVNSPHKSQWRIALMFSLICALNKRLSKQSWGCGFDTPSCSLWRHCNGAWYKIARCSYLPGSCGPEFPFISKCLVVRHVTLGEKKKRKFQSWLFLCWCACTVFKTEHTWLNHSWDIINLGTNFNEMLIEIHIFSFNKIYLKMSFVNVGHFFSASMC